MMRRKSLKRGPSFALTTLSALALLATASTTPALAEAKEDLDTADTNLISGFVEKSASTAERLIGMALQDANDLFSVSEDTERSLGGHDTLDSSDEPSNLSAPDSSLEGVSTAGEVNNDDPIVIEGDTVIIQGDATSAAIHSVMQSADPDVATTVLFKNEIVITVTETGNEGIFGPFKWLKYVKAEEGAKVSFAGISSLVNCFYNDTKLESIDGLSAWDVSTITGGDCMAQMFGGCAALTSLDALSSWDVSGVKGEACMYCMFTNCQNVHSLDPLSTWDLSNMTGDYCMNCMFQECTGITSIEGLSAWNLSEVSGYQCIAGLFYSCTALTSIDALANWNLTNAFNSAEGVYLMFSGCTSVSSLTVDPSCGFRLTSDMNIPSSFPTGGNYWWPEKGVTEGVTTSEMVTKSLDTATYGNRWVRGEKDVNPYIEEVVPTVTWTITAKPYTGENQTIGPDKVEVDGTELTPGIDYVVYYTQVEPEEPDALFAEYEGSPTVREIGTYTAKLYLQGKYIGKENPSYVQTVYVTDASTVTLSFNAGEGIFASTGTHVLTLGNLQSGQLIDTVEEPILAGYSFAGWTDENGNPVSFPLIIPDNNASFTAIWSGEPGPGPMPPEPTPASDSTLIPSTGDSTRMPTAILTLSVAVLLGIAVICLAIKRIRFASVDSLDI